MLIGIDATHDTRNNKKSVYAFVSSYDKDFAKFYNDCCILGVGQEFDYRNLDRFMWHALKYF